MATAVENKWASTIKRLQVLKRDCYTKADGISYLKAIGLVKSNLRVAVYYLGRLDDRGENYQVPFDRERFEWLLSEPVGQKKLDEAIRIKHECAEMVRRNAYEV
ncbi:hypothetical protein [Limosilactobacillus vaginalis]|uniref:hypothetical protein n=1 Tax=Limosilactobacillus vaginalis TaxID=1633 RepID=UPI003612B2B9